VKGVQKHDKKKCKKSMSKTFSEKILRKSTKIRCRFSSTSFVLLRFQVFLCDGGSKTLPKRFYKKNVSKSFYKKIDPKIPNRFFLGFILSRFWAFLGEGTLKTRLKISLSFFLFECPLSRRDALGGACSTAPSGCV
jgi:hypothetical protein